MSTYVRMHVLMYVSSYVRVYVCRAYVCTYVRMYVCTCVVCTYVRVYVCTCVRVPVLMMRINYMYARICTHVRIYTYIRIYVYTMNVFLTYGIRLSHSVPRLCALCRAYIYCPVSRVVSQPVAPALTHLEAFYGDSSVGLMPWSTRREQDTTVVGMSGEQLFHVP